ncbi:hypothetical protein B9Z55_015350 [Caenorhabditis nigoni]|uniref:BHLH domain-containing protein n=1 Tax=Caenorhabditis nigoni TaxID=1611254 RepID=A0A2G5UAJ9_9PELO|nr:hypothetical protein B9Z55_015350 [Caenorhabditis nigoni]
MQVFPLKTYLVWIGKNGVKLLDELWKVLVDDQIALKKFTLYYTIFRDEWRERQRVSQMNEMFDVLISLLPPSDFRLRLSRAQALRKAAKYIHQLVEHLETSDGNDSITKFPHIFLKDRQSKTVNYRTPVNSSSVTAFISRHDLPEEPNHISILTPIVSQNPIYLLPPTTTFIISGSFDSFFHG